MRKDFSNGSGTHIKSAPLVVDHVQVSGPGNGVSGMKTVSLFSSMVINMVAVGEEGGRLEESLLEVADFYEKEVDEAVKLITSLIEPAIIIIIGAVVGFIVFAMLMPIFNIDMAIK